MKTIEKLYRESFEDYKQQPDSKNWKSIEKKISKPNFFRFSATSFNIFYLVAIIIVTGLTVIIVNQTNTTDKIIAISENSNLILNNKKIDISENQENIIIENIEDRNSKNKIITSEIADNQSVENTNVKIISGTSDVKSIKINETTETTETIAKKLEKIKLQTVANFNISLLDGCAPLKVDFTNKSQNYNSIDWDLGNGVISNEQTVTYTYTKPGVYIVSLTVTGDDNTQQLYDTIIVYNKPTSEFDINKNNIYKNENVEFVNKSDNANRYSWIFGDGKSSFEENPTHSYNNTGDYEVKLITISENQCSDTASFDLIVKKDDTKIIFPNAIRPNLAGGTGGYYSTNNTKGNVFHPVTEENIDNYVLRVYDKTGLLLFESKEVNIGWDGYYKNKLMPIGVYIYESKGTFENGDNFYYKGDITLIHSQQR